MNPAPPVISAVREMLIAGKPSVRPGSFIAATVRLVHAMLAATSHRVP